MPGKTEKIMEKTETMPDKKEAIMEAALLLFTKRGFHGTPTSLISKEAGVATGTLFHYFKTKEELIDALYTKLKAEYRESLIEGLDYSLTVEEKMKTLCKNSILWAVNNPEKYSFIRLFCSSPVISGRTREDTHSRFTFVFDIFKEGISSGIFHDGGDELPVIMYISAVNGVCEYIINNNMQNEAESISDRAFDQIWKGITQKQRLKN